MSNKVDVVICGETITLKSTENEAHLKRIAHYLDQKMAEFTAVNASASINERIRTLLIAVNLTDEYFKAEDKLESLRAEHEKYIVEIGRMQQENMLLREKLHGLQGDHTRLQAEFEAFLNEFDNKKHSEGDNVLPLPRTDERKTVIM